jgi:hypothetical protein
MPLAPAPSRETVADPRDLRGARARGGAGLLPAAGGRAVANDAGRRIGTGREDDLAAGPGDRVQLRALFRSRGADTRSISRNLPAFGLKAIRIARTPAAGVKISAHECVAPIPYGTIADRQAVDGVESPQRPPGSCPGVDRRRGRLAGGARVAAEDEKLSASASAPARINLQPRRPSRRASQSSSTPGGSNEVDLRLPSGIEARSATAHCRRLTSSPAISAEARDRWRLRTSVGTLRRCRRGVRRLRSVKAGQRRMSQEIDHD